MKNKNEKTPRPSTVLRFSPFAWAKLLYLRDARGTEIGGFGCQGGRKTASIDEGMRPRPTL